MIYTIKFNELSTMLIDFVDGSEGLLYLRMAGAEPVVNAIWAKLSARDSRGQKWGSEVIVPIAGRSYPQYVTAQKRVTYRTLRTRLPSGMVDLALIHPLLTVAEDNQQGFYILAYDQGIPPGFFDRLNRSLAIPLKPEWSPWLWAQGRQPQSFPALETRRVLDESSGQYVDKPGLTQLTETPISQMNSLGQVACYAVRCDGRYRDAWLQIIRQQLGLGIRLKKVPAVGNSQRYLNGQWVALPATGGWALRHGEEIVAQAPSVEHLFTAARETLGVHFIVEEENSNGSFSR